MSGITSIGIVILVDQALEQFGKYSWDDKGPCEVMDIEDLCKELKLLGSNQAAAVLEETSTVRKHDGRVQDLVNLLVECYLQDWDELYEQKWIADQVEDHGLG